MVAIQGTQVEKAEKVKKLQHSFGENEFFGKKLIFLVNIFSNC